MGGGLGFLHKKGFHTGSMANQEAVWKAEQQAMAEKAKLDEIKNAEKAAEALVREGYLRWKREEEGIVDDITCVIVFLDVKLPQQDPNPNLVQHEKAAAAAATASLTSEVDPKTTESDK